MKKMIISIASLLIIITTSIFVVKYINSMQPSKCYYNKAIITMEDGNKKEIDVDEIYTYSGGRIKIVAKDGTVYLVSSYNTILKKE